MTTATDPTLTPAPRWCWGAGRDPHVSTTATQRPGHGDAVLCDPCHLRALRTTGTTPRPRPR